MAQFVAGRVRAVALNRLPVIVDAAAAQRAHLQVGTACTLGMNALIDYKDNLAGTQFTCVVLAIVQHLPSVNVGAAAQPNDAAATIYGVSLVDFSTLAGVYQRYFSQPQKRLAFAIKTGNERPLASAVEANLPINHVSLRTEDDPTLLEQLRSVLASPRYRLENLYDRRVILESLQVEPLAVDLLLLLMVGAITTLLLALIGYLLVAWVGVRLRASNFAVLRPSMSQTLRVNEDWIRAHLKDCARNAGISVELCSKIWYSFSKGRYRKSVLNIRRNFAPTLFTAYRCRVAC